MKQINLYLVFKSIMVLLLVTLPWLNATYSDLIEPEKITSDLSFYEINTCEVSAAEFLMKNPNTIYQDHYYFTLNNYSSIACFGQVAGVSQVGQDFYIAIGTNSLISTLIQGLFWIICISLISKNKENTSNKRFFSELSVVLTSLLFTYQFFSEVRFYEKTFYLLDMSQANSYMLLFIILYFIIKNLSQIITNRTQTMINYLPFMYLFVGTFSGLNVNLFLFVFVYFGIQRVFNGDIKTKYLYLSGLLTLFWTINAIGDNFSFKPDKIRGLTSSFFSYRTTLAWSLVFFFSVVGIYFIFKESSKYFDLLVFRNNLFYTSTLLIIFGYVGANNPFINFLNYFYLGQEKMGTSQSNPFEFNEWSEKLAWRGFTSSAETSGEFYALAIIFIVFYILVNNKVDTRSILMLPVPAMGLYFSNNRTAFLLLLLGLFLVITNKFEIKKKYMFLSLGAVALLFAFFIGLDKFTYSYSYQSIFIQSNLNTITDSGSTYQNYLNLNYQNDNVYTILFSTFTFIGYILNRSELWGLFIARYNPNYFEYLFGSGPYNFGQFYSEVKIQDTSSFLMPHSSLLSFIIFFGIIGTAFLIYNLGKIFYLDYENINKKGRYLIVFILFNLIKSDSINYIYSAVTYYFLIFYILKAQGKLFSKNEDSNSLSL